MFHGHTRASTHQPVAVADAVFGCKSEAWVVRRGQASACLGLGWGLIVINHTVTATGCNPRRGCHCYSCNRSYPWSCVAACYYCGCWPRSDNVHFHEMYSYITHRSCRTGGNIVNNGSSSRSGCLYVCSLESRTAAAAATSKKLHLPLPKKSKDARSWCT